MTKRLSTLAAVIFTALLALPGCYDDVPNLNGLDLDELEENPTPQLINEAAVGLLIGHRAGKGAANGYVSTLGVLGRESYNLDPADPRFRSELLETELNPGSPAFGGNFWTLPYRNIKNAYTLIRALDQVAGMSDGEKNVIRGFAETIIALEFLTIVNTRDENAGPVDVDRGVNDELAPLVTKDQMFDEIERLLLQGCGNMGGCPESEITGATAPFSFQLGSGFDSFSSPEAFTQFNRAIAARVLVYRQNWDLAEAALDASFEVQDAAALDNGVYHVYSTGSGDTVNNLSSVNIYAHPSMLTGARLKGDGNPDDRATSKLALFSDLGEEQGGSVTSGDNTYTSDYRFAVYQDNTAPIPIIRNEELILLRAEVHIGREEYEEARVLLNFVRENAGGLTPIPVDGLTAANAVDELLYDRRYSLMMEGGHRWIDMRRYGKLNDLLADDEFEGLQVYNAFPIPNNEDNARQ